MLPAVGLLAAILASGLSIFGPLRCAMPLQASRRAPKKAEAIVSSARGFLGRRGAADRPSDCSHFVQLVFRRHGIELPRSAAEQAELGERVAWLRQGDLVFFSGRLRSRRVGHVGIYASDGGFIHVPNADEGVRSESLQSPAYRRRFLFARRVVP